MLSAQSELPTSKRYGLDSQPDVFDAQVTVRVRGAGLSVSLSLVPSRGEVADGLLGPGLGARSG